MPLGTEALECGNCGRKISSPFPAGAAACQGCGEPLTVHCFPAFARGAVAAPGPELVAQGEASCFYHPMSRAELHCDECGRFLCALCDLDLDGRHLCPACLDRGVRVEKAASLEEKRVLYDSIALHLTIWPALTVWGAVFAAPAALFIAVRHWRSPLSILPRSRFRFWLAVIFASSQILAIAAFIVALVWYVPQSGPK